MLRPDYEVLVFEVTSAGSVRLLRTVPLGDSRDWDATADARFVAWTDHSERSGWELGVKWMDVDSGAERRAVIGPPHMGFITISGFTPDQRAIVVPRADLVRGSPQTSAIPTPLTIHAVDIASGTVRDVGTSTVTATSAGRGGWQLPAFGAAVGEGPNVSWATIALDQQRSTLGDLVVGGPEGSHTVAMKPHSSTRFWKVSSLRIVGDRELRIGDQYSVDLETGTVSGPSPPMTSAPWLADPRYARTTPSPDGTHAAEVSVMLSPGASASDRTLRLQVWRRRP